MDAGVGTAISVARGYGGVCRQATGVGKEPERLLDAVLQFLDSGLSYIAETQSPPLPSVYAFVGSALIEMVGRLELASFNNKLL